MRKLIITTFLILGLAATSFSGDYFEGTPQNLYPAGTTTKQLLTDYTTVGGSGDIVNTKFIPDQGTWELVVTGSPTAYNISIQGSIRCTDGTFYPISEMTEADIIKMKHIALKSVPCIRAKLNSMTGSGSFNVYILMRGQ